MIYLITRIISNPDNLDGRLEYYSTLGISPSWTAMAHVADRFTIGDFKQVIDILLELANHPEFNNSYTTLYLTKTTEETLNSL